MRYLLTLALVLGSCKSDETTVVQAKHTDTATPGQGLCAAVSDISGEYCPAAKVDVQNLSIAFLGAGVQTTRNYSENYFYRFVRLFFHTSLARDYLEIMRCNGDKRDELVCRDGQALDARVPTPEVQAALDDPSGPTVNREGLRDCWASIAEQQFCVWLGGAKDSNADRMGRVYAAEHFVDVSAPAGQTFFYVARPCVHADRANELTSGNKNCAQQLYVSNTVTDLKNYTINGKLLAARQKVAVIAARLNYLTEKAYKITLDFSRVLQQYEEDDIKRRRGKSLRQGIAMITGLAIGAAGAVYTSGIDSIGSGLDAGQALGSAFADIIASKDDYPLTCYECMDLRAALIEVVGDVGGNNLSADGMAFIEDSGEGTFTQGAGHIYQQALDEYAEALQKLGVLQQEHSGYELTGTSLDQLGSRGGPP